MDTLYTWRLRNGYWCDIEADSLDEAMAKVETGGMGELHWAQQPDADGFDEDGNPCHRMLAWETQADSICDPGVRAVGQLEWKTLIDLID